MGIFQLIAILVIIGVVMWAINTQVTVMDPTIKKVLNIAVVVLVVLWVLSVAFPGALGFANIHVGRG